MQVQVRVRVRVLALVLALQAVTLPPLVTDTVAPFLCSYLSTRWPNGTPPAPVFVSNRLVLEPATLFKAGARTSVTGCVLICAPVGSGQVY